MLRRFLSLCRLAATGAALMAAVRAGAQLAANSPFLPPPTGGPAAPTAGATLEFVGYIETPEGIQYRLYDPAKKTGTWVKLNERNPDLDVRVKQHDGNHNTLTVEHQGRTLTLAERESKVLSSGNAVQPMPLPAPVPVAAAMPAAVTQPVVVNPTPADEQRRLEAVAAEVARRRALREQASQQMNQGGAPQMQNFRPDGQPQNSQRVRGQGGRQQR